VSMYNEDTLVNRLNKRNKELEAELTTAMKVSINDQKMLEEAWAERDKLREVLQAAVDCGMVPTSSAANGGAPKHSKQVRVADQIRAVLGEEV
jgi:hypothetical protein